MSVGQVTEVQVAELRNSRTAANLREAFAREAQTNRRLLYFAQKADVEGFPDVAALLRKVAEGETSHAFGHLSYLGEAGDPLTGKPMGCTADNLRSAIQSDRYEYEELYPRLAKEAREEGFEDIAEWLETLARAEASHTSRLVDGLSSVEEDES